MINYLSPDLNELTVLADHRYSDIRIHIQSCITLLGFDPANTVD